MRMVLAASLFTAVVLAFAGVATAQMYSATINGSQEVPPNPTLASGSGTFTLDAAKMLSFNISSSGFQPLYPESAAHIHGPALPGVNAGVLFPLPPGGNKVGVVGPLTPAQEADLNAGLWYVNIHSELYPGGEIRGQIILTVVPTREQSWSAIKALYTAGQP